MKVITVINQKGGVGKTVTALSLGAGLATQGRKVLMVDLDAQCNLTYSILGSEEPNASSLSVLQQPNCINDSIVQAGILYLLPAEERLVLADSLLEHEQKRSMRLKEAFGQLERSFDFIVIDTPPALSILTVNALIASDYFLVPARADIFSLRGIRQLATTVAAVKQSANPKLKALGIVLTTYSARSQISRSITELLTEEAEALNTQVLQTKIRECAAMKEALALSQNIFSYAPKSTVAQDYRALIDEISREIKA